MNKIIGIIPARAGSKRLPGKNIKILKNKPLISWIIESALESKLLSKVVVSSDSKEIKNISNQYPKLEFIDRPVDIATDTSPAIDYVNHVLEYYSKENIFFDIITILQPTSPLTSALDIDQCIKKLIDSDSDSVVSVMKVPHHIHPSKLKILNKDKVLPYIEDEKKIKLASEIKDVYSRNCSVYVSKRSVIESGRIIGKDCRSVIMPRERSVDINDIFDFEFAKFLFDK